MEFNKLAQRYKTELLENIIPFWEDHSIDREFGGYFTCLDRQGNVFDTDKFVWLQARQVWMFSKLYNEVEPRRNWLETAEAGAGFLRKYGRDGNLDWYFSLTREGRPLIQPYNIFSDCFACMGFGQLAKAAGTDEYASLAIETFNRIRSRSGNPKGKYSKSVPGTRDLKNFALPMILCNLSLELEHLLDRDILDQTIRQGIYELVETFYQPDTGLICENVNLDGSPSDSFEGRLIVPGHAIEGMWFLMDLAKRINDPSLMEWAVEVMLRTIEFGWDQEFGGLFYFMDRKGHPTQQLEWDQKLWWVHVETLVGLLKGYYFTRNPACLEWFGRIDDYTWKHFRDPEYPEWFGYLNRQGDVLLPLKGGKWKGCFHIPRGLLQCWRILEKLDEKPAAGAVAQ